MKNIEIYEPPLCCLTGVCGPAPNPELAEIQDSVFRLKKSGHSVERIVLNQQPGKFMSNPLIKEILTSEGKESLPVTIIDGKVFMKGRYPKYIELNKEVQNANL